MNVPPSLISISRSSSSSSSTVVIILISIFIFPFLRIRLDEFGAKYNRSRALNGDTKVIKSPSFVYRLLISFTIIVTIPPSKHSVTLPSSESGTLTFLNILIERWDILNWLSIRLQASTMWSSEEKPINRSLKLTISHRSLNSPWIVTYTEWKELRAWLLPYRCCWCCWNVFNSDASFPNTLLIRVSTPRSVALAFSNSVSRLVDNVNLGEITSAAIRKFPLCRRYFDAAVSVSVIFFWCVGGKQLAVSSYKYKWKEVTILCSTELSNKYIESVTASAASAAYYASIHTHLCVVLCVCNEKYTNTVMY